MKKSQGDKVRLQHILDAISEIDGYIEEISFHDFFNSSLHKAAVVKQLEVIGEAVNSISDSIKKNHPEIEWEDIKRLRNIVVHEYFDIDYEIIWDTAKYNLPAFKREIKKILKKLK